MFHVNCFFSNRRFPKRVYVMMPDLVTRRGMLTHLLAKQGNPLSHKELDGLAKSVVALLFQFFQLLFFIFIWGHIM